MSEFDLKEVSIGHTYIFRADGSQFSFFVLGANPEMGIRVKASRPKKLPMYPGGPKVETYTYWLPLHGHMEVRPDEVTFVIAGPRDE